MTLNNNPEQRNKPAEAPILEPVAYIDGSIQKKVPLADSGVLEGIKVPVFSFDKKESDFFKVLRCNASYKFVTLTGEDINNPTITLKDKEWAWSQAINDSFSCNIVGTHISATKFPDLASPGGSYYYVANPCFGKEKALSTKERCSYNLSRSDVYTFKDTLRKEIRDKSRELADAEGALNSKLEKAIFYANVLEIRLRACENMVAFDSALNQFKGGLVMMGLLVVGGSLGFALGGGPNLAVMIGQMSMMIGGMLVNMKLGLLPVQNSCLQGVPPISHFKGQEKFHAFAKKYALKFEELFSVQKTLEGLQKTLSVDIPQAKARVEKVMQQMAALDNRTVTVDEAIVKANKMGFDPFNPNTYSNVGMGPTGGLPFPGGLFPGLP